MIGIRIIYETNIIISHAILTLKDLSNMGIDPKYVRVEEEVVKRGVDKEVCITEIIDFPNYFLDLLLEDREFSRFILAAKLPGGREYRDAQKSSLIGKAPGLFTGMPWENIPEGTILFDGCWVNSMMLDIGRWWAHMAYTTPTLHQGPFGNAIVRAKTEGFLKNKKLVGVEIKGNPKEVPGFSDIENDKDLIDKVFLLFKSDLLVYQDFKGNLRGNEIKFSVIQNPFSSVEEGKKEYGAIEIGLGIHLETIREKGVDYAFLCKTSFEVVNGIAEHLKPMWIT